MPQILIVDDNKAFVSTLVEIFDDEGFTSEVAYEANGALAQVESNHFNLALIDIKLPGMQGDELASLLVEKQPDLACILITGNATLETAISAVSKYGVVGYELKPLNLDRLLLMVRQTMARQKAEEETRRKTEELKDALAAKTEFLSVVSHELRTPLVPIVGYTEMLLDGEYGELPEELIEPIRAISGSAETLRTLIEDLLLITRLDRGSPAPDPEAIEAGPFIEEVLKTYREVHKEKSVKITVEGEVVEILADRGRLRQVLENLIGNAIKHSGTSVEITITTSISNGFGVISVADNGPGIAPEHQEKIFDRFYQIAKVGTRVYKGSGLGLAIVKELTEHMNGTVSVESELGKGSTFSIALPLANPVEKSEETESAEHDKTTETQEPATATAIPNGPLRVLLIDDDPFTLDLVQKILGGDYDLTVAISGATGLGILEKKPVDMILLDWMMPGLDGFSVLLALKANDSTRDIPVLFLSGKTEPESVEQGLEAGAVDFITKPFTRSELIERIERARR